jgi:NADH:ubiquinone oxidoreductase subunit B-like Fe-S oxidoreductase
VYIPGCPPNPEGIIDSVVAIQKMLETGAPRAAERWPIKI